MSPQPHQAERRYADVRLLASYLNSSVPTIWRQVAAGRIPAPFYISPSAPRWDLNEVDRAIEATRALPRDAMEARRQARLAGFVSRPMMGG